MTGSCFWRQVSKTWCRVAADEYLWRDLVYRHWSIDRSIPQSRFCSSWREEYERLSDHCPVIESEVLRSHTDQVLHVSFSHDGQLFATTSKDGFIKVSTKHFHFCPQIAMRTCTYCSAQCSGCQYPVIGFFVGYGDVLWWSCCRHFVHIMQLSRSLRPTSGSATAALWCKRLETHG